MSLLQEKRNAKGGENAVLLWKIHFHKVAFMLKNPTNSITQITHSNTTQVHIWQSKFLLLFFHIPAISFYHTVSPAGNLHFGYTKLLPFYKAIRKIATEIHFVHPPFQNMPTLNEEFSWRNSILKSHPFPSQIIARWIWRILDVKLNSHFSSDRPSCCTDFLQGFPTVKQCFLARAYNFLGMSQWLWNTNL